VTITNRNSKDVSRAASPNNQMSIELDFLQDDDDSFFASIAGSLNRNKARTDYLRRPSNVTDKTPVDSSNET
jgi:hypothetical protein